MIPMWEQIKDEGTAMEQVNKELLIVALIVVAVIWWQVLVSHQEKW